MSALRLRAFCVRIGPHVLRPLVPCSPVVGKATRDINSTKVQCDPACHCSLVDRREAWWVHKTRAGLVQAEHRRDRGGQGDHRGAIGTFIYARSFILNSGICIGADP